MKSKEDRKVSFQYIVEGKSKSLGAKEKEKLLNIVVKGEDGMFLQSIEEEQIFCSFEKDGECHKDKYDDYEFDEDKYEMLQQIELINLVHDKDRVQEESFLGKHKEKTVSHGGEFGNVVSLQCSDLVSK